jgi:hypothetical protein
MKATKIKSLIQEVLKIFLSDRSFYLILPFWELPFCISPTTSLKTHSHAHIPQHVLSPDILFWILPKWHSFFGLLLWNLGWLIVQKNPPNCLIIFASSLVVKCCNSLLTYLFCQYDQQGMHTYYLHKSLTHSGSSNFIIQHVTGHFALMTGL